MCHRHHIGTGTPQNSSSNMWSKLASFLEGGPSSTPSSSPGVMQQATDFVNKTAVKIETITTGTWKALGMEGDAEGMQGGAVTCYPSDGDAVVEAVTGADCTVIMLSRTYFDYYNINQTMVVSRRKVIIGNPLTMPALHPQKIERLFHGKTMAKASLD